MAHERCHLCDTEFASGEGWSVLCERCDSIERAELNATEGHYPITRTEQQRERLGVSGNVDE